MSNAKNLATFLQSGGSIAGDANFDSNTLFVDASANRVGIGNASPTTALDITGTITSDGLTLDNNGSIIFNDPQATDTILIGTNDDELVIRADAGDIVLKTNNNSTSAVVDASGNLLVGKTSITNSGGGHVLRGSDSALFSRNASNVLSETIQITRHASDGMLMRLNTGSSGTATMKAGIGVLNGDGMYFTIGTSGTTAMTIDSSGNLLVGKTSSDLTTTGSEVQDGAMRIVASSTSTNLATNSGASLLLGNPSNTANNFSNIGSYNTNQLVDSQINFIHESHSSRTGAISFNTHDGSSLGEAMRIDSAKRVGIGANISSYPASGYDSRSNDFVISGAGDTGLTIAGGSTEDIRLVFTANGTSGLSKGSLTYDNANDSLAIETSGTGRMTVDGNGLVLIGTTDTSPYNNSAGSSADNGVVFSAGRIWAARYSGTPMDLNRTSDDGTLIDFRKNGSVVGQIGVSGNGFFFGDEGDTGFVIDSNTDAIIPFNPSTRAIRDNAIHLGSSSGRFKNFHLNGGIYFGSRANALDDYEEGSWTPASPDGTITVTGTPTYVKIGKMVFVQADITMFTSSSGTQAKVDGLPFAVDGNGTNSQYNLSPGEHTYGSYITLVAIPTTDRIVFRPNGGTSTSYSGVSGKRFRFSGWYETT